jgi:hypothetical protein
MGNIAFVASTLPVPLLKKKIKEWEIHEIIIAGENIKDSYEYMIKEYPWIKLKIVPKGKLTNLAYLFIKLFSIRLKKNKIFFFHECCWFNFDLLIDYFNIEGFFYPQVTLNGFEKISPAFPQKNLQYFLLKLLIKSDEFSQYQVPYDDSVDFFYVLSKNKYNQNIKKFSIEQSYLLRKDDDFVDKKKTNDVLVLLAKETVSDEMIINIYEEIIEKLLLWGFNVYIKNHPRKDSRLEIKKNDKVNEIPAHIPFELLDRSFDFVIGCASTSLIHPGVNAYSIINFSGMDEIQVKKRISHLSALPNHEMIIFPKTKEILLNLLNETYNHKNLNK